MGHFCVKLPLLLVLHLSKCQLIVELCPMIPIKQAHVAAFSYIVWLGQSSKSFHFSGSKMVISMVSPILHWVYSIHLTGFLFSPTYQIGPAPPSKKNRWFIKITNNIWRFPSFHLFFTSLSPIPMLPPPVSPCFTGPPRAPTASFLGPRRDPLGVAQRHHRRLDLGRGVEDLRGVPGVDVIALGGT